MIEDYKRNLNERKINLDDDYIKFIRYGEVVSNNDTQSILAYISNNSFLDGITHRIMRKHLLNSFSKIYILNLHGNIRKQETSPDGSFDGNVFGIKQGVSINIFINNKNNNDRPRIYYNDVYGEVNNKFTLLSTKPLKDLEFKEVFASDPYYFFTPKNLQSSMLYDKAISIKDLFKVFASGIQTKCDSISVKMKRRELEEVLYNFSTLSVNELKKLYSNKKETSGWNFTKAKEEILNKNYKIIELYFRPFDIRYSVYTGRSSGFIGRSREQVMKHFLHENVGLLSTRNHSLTAFSHILATNLMSDIHSVSDQTYVFPLFLYDDNSNTKTGINFNQDKVTELLSEIDYGYDASVESAINVFAYSYAVLFSTNYRLIYSEFLKIEYPKILRPSSLSMFNSLVLLGKELLDCHLEKNRYSNDLKFFGDNKVIANSSYKNNKIFINKSSYIYNISETVWNYRVGLYCPVQNYLKLRKNMILNDETICKINNIIKTIEQTIVIVNKIDTILNKSVF